MTNSISDFKQYSNNHFEFSDFQNDACRSIEQNKHVLITAHTGSGKTLPAEFAIYYYIKVLGKKVVYTSPIKALSNQKYKEFTEKFQDVEVGILTGDIKHNPNADLLIMTTEILQNNCFKKANNGLYMDFNLDIDNELGCVIFDEVHYIDDIDRGTVWEQTMILLPDHVLFVMLSATIGQKEEFAKWIETIKKREVVICSNSERVVPLTFYEYFNVPTKYVDNIKDKNKKKQFIEKTQCHLNIIKTPKSYYYKPLLDTKKCIQELEKDKFRVHQKFIINECLEHLKNKDMFPALMFIFSRKQVENISKQISVNLFLEDEKDYMVEPIYRQMIVSKLNNWKEYVELPEYQTYLNLLEKGIGIHHAGMLPIFREIIEQLYEQKYIKVLIATETFAIGLNMPTRTVIFNSLYKHDGNSVRPLKSHEFIQMAGRAGRRNIDKVGHVVLLTNNYEPLMENQYHVMFHSSPKVLKSKFKLTYNLILNHIEHFKKEDFVNMVDKSLMNNDIQKQIQFSRNMLKHLELELQQYMKIAESLEFNLFDVFDNYYDLKIKYSQSKNKEKRKLKMKIDEFEFQKSKMIQKGLYDTIKELKYKLKKEQDILYYSENYVNTQINNLYNILKYNCYLNDADKPSQAGLNVSYLHEIPCLVFGDFYQKYDRLSKYNETDLLMILSCFYPMKIKDDEKVNVPSCLKYELQFIESRINYYSDYELQHELYITTSYVLQYDMMEIVKTWYEEIENIIQCKIFFHELESKYGIFIGDFVKCCLKIVNICNELKQFCENDSNFSLIEKLDNIQHKLQKNIITNKSLYI
jgi:superfamily II RNA helicase